MDKSLAVERMTETENLTDSLDDDDANWLLGWGASHVGGLIEGIADDEVAGEKVNQLMAVMRALNGIAADHNAKDPADLASDIEKLAAQYAAAFGAAATQSAEDVAQLARALPTLTPREVMQRLLDFLAPAHSPPAGAPQLSQTTQQTSATATTPAAGAQAAAPPREPEPPQDHAEPEPEPEPEPESRTPSDH